MVFQSRFPTYDLPAPGPDLSGQEQAEVKIPRVGARPRLLRGWPLQGVAA